MSKHSTKRRQNVPEFDDGKPWTIGSLPRDMVLAEIRCDATRPRSTLVGVVSWPLDTRREPPRRGLWALEDTRLILGNPADRFPIPVHETAGPAYARWLAAAQELGEPFSDDLSIPPDGSSVSFVCRCGLVHTIEFGKLRDIIGTIKRGLAHPLPLLVYALT